MYDRDKNRLRRQDNEAKHLLRKLRERGGLSNGELARLRRVSGRATKVASQQIIEEVYNYED